MLVFQSVFPFPPSCQGTARQRSSNHDEVSDQIHDLFFLAQNLIHERKPVLDPAPRYSRYRLFEALSKVWPSWSLEQQQQVLENLYHLGLSLDR